MTTKFSKKYILGPFLMLLTAVTLVACGDSPTATPEAAATTAAASSTTAAASATTAASGATNGAAPGGNAPSGTPGAGGRGQGGFGGFNVVTGTIQTFDSASKSLTVQENSGSSQTFDVSNAIVNKNTKLALADLSKENLASDSIQVTGQKGSDGTYTATALNLTDTASMANNGVFPGAGANGTPGAFPGRGNGGFNGTPGAGRRNANGTPGANGQQGANGTPGTNGQQGAGGFGGGNRLILNKATLSGNTLTGTDQSGASVTVNLSDSTDITKRVGGNGNDLTAGAKISVNFRPAQNNGTAAAAVITIEQ